MGLFKKKEKSCCNIDIENINEIEDARIKILGTGCNKCLQLERNTQKAIDDLGIKEPISHVTDLGNIALYGIMSTPALVINEEVVSYGKVLRPDEIKILIESHL